MSARSGGAGASSRRPVICRYPRTARHQPNFMSTAPSASTKSGPAVITPSGHRPPTHSFPLSYECAEPKSAFGSTCRGSTGRGRVTGHGLPSGVAGRGGRTVRVAVAAGGPVPGGPVPGGPVLSVPPPLAAVDPPAWQPGTSAISSPAAILLAVHRDTTTVIHRTGRPSSHFRSAVYWKR